jgi:hypothetical protein
MSEKIETLADLLEEKLPGYRRRRPLLPASRKRIASKIASKGAGSIVAGTLAANRFSPLFQLARLNPYGAAAATAYGLYELAEATDNFDPEELGKVAANVQKSLKEVASEAVDVARQIGAPVQDYVNKVVRGYQTESNRPAPVEDPNRRTIEIDLQNLDSGRTISDRDREIAEPNPFDKLFPYQTVTGMKDGGEAKFDAEKSDLDNDGKISDYERARGTAIARNMNQGGEIDMALEDVSRGTMDMEAPQMQPSQEEMAAVQQIMDMVMQMMQSGASEEEIIAALKEMGLSDQDIALIMQAIVEQGQQQNPIDAELSQMM